MTSINEFMTDLYELNNYDLINENTFKTGNFLPRLYYTNGDFKYIK